MLPMAKLFGLPRVKLALKLITDPLLKQLKPGLMRERNGFTWLI
jgi:hypothetical protein